ncbi:MAG: DUF1566 domain-containing protein [Treponema sp.]|nr:DUF1566 domain-containing protein [Treponema sp.]
MKKMVFCVILVIMVLMGCATKDTAVAETKRDSLGMDLVAAINAAATRMGENLPGGTKVALVSVASSSAQLSEYIISRLEAALVGGKKLVVVDRANLDKVREEQGFQLSGEVDDNSAKTIGKLLGAGAIVTGAFTSLGDVYGLTLKAINIETATVAVSYPADIAKSARIETLLASEGGGAGTGTRTAQAGENAPLATLAAQLAASTPAVAPQAAPAPAQAAEAPPPASTIYKIGDTGPAGGIIFYDKGNNSGGWRYLEAAPATTEVTCQWSISQTIATKSIQDSRGLGTGKSNTEYIMQQAMQIGGGFGWAAQICDELEVNGFDDWFLPSRDELNVMWGVLHRKGQGGFKSAWYWSSTPSNDNGAKIWIINFTDGGQLGDLGGYPYNNWDRQYRVRAIRQF